MSRAGYLSGFIASMALCVWPPFARVCRNADPGAGWPDASSRNIACAETICPRWRPRGVFSLDVMETEGCKFLGIKGCQGNQTTLRFSTPGGLYAECQEGQGERTHTDVIRRNYTGSIGQASVEGDWQAHERKKTCGIGKYWKREISSLRSYVVWGGSLSAGEVEIAATVHANGNGEIYANSVVPTNLFNGCRKLGR